MPVVPPRVERVKQLHRVLQWSECKKSSFIGKFRSYNFQLIARKFSATRQFFSKSSFAVLRYCRLCSFCVLLVCSQIAAKLLFDKQVDNMFWKVLILNFPLILDFLNSDHFTTLWSRLKLTYFLFIRRFQTFFVYFLEFHEALLEY